MWGYVGINEDEEGGAQSCPISQTKSQKQTKSYSKSNKTVYTWHKLIRPYNYNHDFCLEREKRKKQRTTNEYVWHILQASYFFFQIFFFFFVFLIIDNHKKL